MWFELYCTMINSKTVEFVEWLQGDYENCLEIHLKSGKTLKVTCPDVDEASEVYSAITKLVSPLEFSDDENEVRVDLLRNDRV